MENQGGDYSPNGFSNSASNMNAVFNNEITGRSDISNVNHQTGTPRLVPETQIWSMPVPDQLMTMPNRENTHMTGSTVGPNIPMNVAYPNTIYSPTEHQSQFQTPQNRDISTMMEHTNSNDMSGSGKNLKKRVSKACDHCRKRKIRCDEVDQQTKKCSNCIKFQLPCTFKHRDEILKKKRKLEIKHHATPEESLQTSNSISNPVASSSVPNSGRFELLNGNSPLESNIIDKVSNIQNNLNKKMNSKIEKLDRKMSYIIDSVARLEWLLDKAVKKQEGKYKEKNNLPKPARKIYPTALLTAQKLYWFKQSL